MLVFVVIGIVVIGGASWLFLGSHSSTGSHTTPTDWLTYSSASLGFSISYPSDWKYENCGPQCVGWEPKSAAAGELALGIIRSPGTIDKVLTSAKQYLVSQKTLNTGTVSWLTLTLKHPTTGDIITSNFVAQGANLYEFGTAATQQDIVDIYNTMLYSFKFLK